MHCALAALLDEDPEGCFFVWRRISLQIVNFSASMGNQQGNRQEREKNCNRKEDVCAKRFKECCASCRHC